MEGSQEGLVPLALSAEDRVQGRALPLSAQDRHSPPLVGMDSGEPRPAEKRLILLEFHADQMHGKAADFFGNIDRV